MNSWNMSTENQVPAGEETQNQSPEVAEPKPEVAEPEAVEAKPEDETQKAIKRLQQRVNKRTSDYYRVDAENKQLRQILEGLKTEQEPKQSQEDIGAVAERIADAKIYAKTAESIVRKGKESDPKFMDNLRELSSEVGEFVTKDGLPSPFMKAVLDVSDDPAKLLGHLGKNPDLASDLSDLPITKLAARLVMIEKEMTAPQSKPSSAPKPLEAVKPVSSKTGPQDNDDLDTWMKKERARMKEKGLSRYG